MIVPPARIRRLLLTLASLAALLGSPAASAFDFSYSGRLVDEKTGKPHAGPIALQVRFFHQGTGGEPILSVTGGLEDVALEEGVFQITLSLNPSDYHEVFPSVEQPVFVEIKDLTHDETFDRQQVILTPFAARIPVDDKTLAFGSDGKLALAIESEPAANQFLTKDSSGRLVWSTPSVTGIQGQDVSSTPPVTGQALVYDGSRWAPQAVTSGTVTTVTATPPLAVTTASSTPAISITQAGASSAGYLSSADWQAFQDKQEALGFTPVDAAGDVVAGDLSFGGVATVTDLAAPSAASDAATKSYVDTADALALRKDGSVALTAPWAVGGMDISQVGNLSLAASKTLSLGAYTNAQETILAATPLLAADKGKTWFNTDSNQVKVWNGSSIQALGVSGAGLTNLGGQTGNTQLFAVGTSGTSPAFSSASDTHTLNIPLAATGGVTAGLVSNADHTTFSGKVGTVSAGTGIAVNTSGTTATIDLADTAVTAGSYTRASVTVDAQGRLTAAANGAAVNLASEVTGTLPVGSGGTGAATAAGARANLAAAASGANSDITSLAGLTTALSVGQGGTGATATPSNGQLLIGNGTSYTAASLSQGASAGVTITSGAGAITLDTAQDIRTSATPTFAGVSVGAGSVAAASHIAGTGDQSATPGDGSIRAAGGSGTDIAGGDLTLAAGNGTGSGGSGDILLQTAAAGASGATADTMTTRLVVTSAGNVGIGTTSPSEMLQIVKGDNSNNAILSVFSNNKVQGLGLTYHTIQALGTNQSINVTPAGTGNFNVTSGNVGIGTTSPGSKLQVSGGAAIGYATATTAPTNGLAVSGNVGIGSTNPAYKLDVDGAIRATSFISTGNSDWSNANINNVSSLGIGTTTPSGSLSFGGDSARTLMVDRNTTANTAGSNLSISAGGATTAATDKDGGDLVLASGAATGSGTSDIMFQTAASGAAGTADRTATTKMIITGAGNVGIGTTAPTRALDVVTSDTNGGLITATSDYTGSGTFGILTAFKRKGAAAAAAADEAAITFDQKNSSGTRKEYAYIGGGIENATASAEAGYLAFDTTAASATRQERMRITSVGHVGIGTTAPTSKLTIFGDGTGLTTGQSLFQMNGQTNPNYQLRIGYDTSNNFAWIRSLESGSSNYPPLLINPDSGGFGKVGIGINSPSNIGSAFQVNGNAAIGYNTSTSAPTNGLLVSGNVGIGTTAPGATLEVSTATASGLPFRAISDYSAFANAAQVLIQSYSNPNQQLQIGYHTGNDYGSVQAFKQGTGVRPLVLQVLGGNVGIGTTAPAERFQSGAGFVLHDGGDKVVGFGYSPASNNAIMAGKPAEIRWNPTSGGLSIGTDSSSRASGAAATVSARLTIDASGNVGIGTTNPAGLLDVNGKLTVLSGGNVGIGLTNPSTRFHVYGGKARFEGVDISTLSPGGASTTAGVIESELNKHLIFDLLNNEAGDAIAFRYSAANNSMVDTIGFVMKGNGNVGIGSTNPAYKLDVDGAIRATSFISTGNSDWSNANINNVSSLGIGTTTPSGSLSFGGDSVRTLMVDRNTTANTAGSDLSISAGGATTAATDKDGGDLVLASGAATGSGTSDIMFQTAASGAAGTADRAATTKMIITGAGNVGIGTTNPTASLHVRGTTGWPVTVEASGSSTLISSIAGPVIANTDQTANNWVGIHFKDSASGAGSGAIGLQVTDHANDYGDVAIATRSASGFSEKFRVTSAGNVGIGTTAPNNILEISGGAMSFYNPGNWVAVGMDFDATLNALRFRSNNTGSNLNQTNMVIQRTSGNVGIGTTAPGARLHVSGVAKFDDVDVSTLNPGASTLGGVLEGRSGGHLLLDLKNNDTTDAIAFRYSAAANSSVDTVGFVMKGSGNVGVGTTGPAARLHVSGIARLDDVDVSALNPGGPSTSGGVLEGRSGGHLLLDLKNNDTTDTIAFRYSAAANSSVDTIGFVMKGSGNVGIGTTAPAGLLDVNGKLTVLSGGNVGIGTTAPASTLAVRTTDATNNGLASVGLFDHMTSGTAAAGIGGVLQIRAQNSTGASILAADFGGLLTDATNGSEKGAFIVRTATGGSAAEAMRVTNTGNVGIGTTTPGSSTLAGYTTSFSSEKLDVAGEVGSQGYRVIRSNGFGATIDNMVLEYNTNQDSRNTSINTGWSVRAQSSGPTGANPIDLRFYPGYSSAYGATNHALLDVRAANPVLTLGGNGNVGIGTTSPGQKLAVAGTIESTSGGFKFPDGSTQATAATGSAGYASCPSGFTLIGTASRKGNYCIDTDQRVAATWLNAKATCHGLGLSEGEAYLCNENQWYRACTAGSLTNGTNDYEWIADRVNATDAFAIGSGSCSTAGNAGTGNSYGYRCCL